MTKRTKKVGPAGRYSSRYGVRARTRVRDVELLQHKKHTCPRCGNESVKRESTGIWACKKCGNTFAGGAYLPRTESGQNMEKMMKSPSVEETA